MAVMTGKEFDLYYSLEGGGDLTSAGSCLVTAASVITFTDGTDPITVSVETTAYVVPMTNIGAASITVVLTGSTTVGATTKGSTTITPYAGIDQAFAVAVSGNATWRTVTAVSIAGGTAGEAFEVIFFTQSSWTLLNWVSNVNLPDLIASRPIPLKWDPANHYKRIRTTGEITFDINVESWLTGIGAITGRNAMLKMTNKADGRGSVLETWMISMFRANAPMSHPGDDDSEGNAMRRVTGACKRIICIP